jgi:hypothetical protein
MIFAQLKDILVDHAYQYVFGYVKVVHLGCDFFFGQCSLYDFFFGQLLFGQCSLYDFFFDPLIDRLEEVR